MFRLNVKRTRIRRLGARIPNEVLERCIYWAIAHVAEHSGGPFQHRWLEEHRERWAAFLVCALVCKDWARLATRTFYRAIYVNSLAQLDRPLPPGHAREVQYQGVRVRLIRHPSLVSAIGTLCLDITPALSTNQRALLLQRFGQLISICPSLWRIRIDFVQWPLAEHLDPSFVAALGSAIISSATLVYTPHLEPLFVWLARWNNLSELDLVLRPGQRLAGPRNLVVTFRLISFRLSATCYALINTPRLLTLLSLSRLTLRTLALCARHPPAIAATLHLLSDIVRPFATRLEHLGLYDVEDPGIAEITATAFNRAQAMSGLPYCRVLRELELGGTLYGPRLVAEVTGRRQLEVLKLDDTVYRHPEALLGIFALSNAPQRVSVRVHEPWTARERKKVDRAAKRAGVQVVWVG